MILLVLGAAFYAYYSVNKLPEVPVPNNSYAVGVLDNELKVGGVFDKLKQLAVVKASEPAAIQFAPEELGKEDIGLSD